MYPVSQMVDQFYSQVKHLVNESFPEKHITISPFDDPWFNEELRQLRRQRQRRYVSHGKDEKYNEIKLKFDQKLKAEIEKYKIKVENDVIEGRRGSTYPALKKLGSRLYHTPYAGFQLPNHAKMNLSPAQSAELLAEHFSKISQEYSPMNIVNLPPNIRQSLTSYNPDLAPTLSVHDVWARLVKARKPRSTVPGDLPPKLVKHCARTLAAPITTIFNAITSSATFPSQWKVEYQIPISKVSQPESEDDLRNIAKTQFFSKVYESFIGGWLLKIIKPFLDPDQCGLKGFSITHYLVKLMHFVQSSLDNRTPHAVLVASVDISKAFNRIDHNLVIQDLYDMQTPAWLLHIVISYLSDRSMFLTFNNSTSSQKSLPGGGPQGAYLGGLIFIIKYNGAFLRPPVPRPIHGPVSASKSKKVKFVDDGSIAVSVNLKQCLVPDQNERPKPLTYHERTCHVLPPQNNLLQHYIHDVEDFTKNNKMIINKEKTKVISFNKSRKWDFPPEVKFKDGSLIEHVSDMKLVGVILSANLSWYKNTEYICDKAKQKLWILRRMKKLRFSIPTLYDVYKKEVRSIVEMAVPVWHSGLTKQQTSTIEKIQKLAFKIILGEHYKSYVQARKLLSAQTLDDRRSKLCLTFAKKNLKTQESFFTKLQTQMNTRTKTNLVKEYKCRTDRFKRSSLPYLARVLNQDYKTKSR